MEVGRVRIGVRPSLLALKQALEVRPVLEKIYPGATFEVLKIETPGDRDKVTPLTFVDGSDFFTRDIDEALLTGRIDIAVHSAKDLPDVLADGLELLFETPTLSPYDAFVSRNKQRLKDLPPVSRVGLSSLRRSLGIKRLRPDLKIIDIRGDIDKRLELIDKGVIDALIVAHAALLRLGLEEKIAEVFGVDIFSVHPRQGRLAIVRAKRQ